MFPGSLKTNFQVFKESSKGLSRVFQECFRVFQVRFKSVSRVFQEFFKGV